jgi:hypothetical protein
MWTKGAAAYKQLALGVLLDIEGAFDRTSFYVIMEAAEYGVESTIIRWTNIMLESWSIAATL